MIQVEKEKFADISKFLRENAEEIYGIATQKHAKYLDTKHVQEKKLHINKAEAMVLITELAHNLDDSERGAIVFERVGERMAKHSLVYGVTLEEAIESLLFLKQTSWETLEQAGLLTKLTVQEFYVFSSFITTACDSVASKIAFTFHDASASNEARLTLLVQDFSKSMTTLRESEEKYRGLFNEIDEGYVLIDVLFDETNTAVDLLMLEANPAAVRMTGRELVGRRMRELAPTFEADWFEIFGRVAKTGVGERHEYHAAPLSAWYNVYIFKTGNQDDMRVAAMYQDITERKHREANAAFLADVAKDFSHLNSSDEIMQVVGRHIGEFLQVHYCHFMYIDEARDEILHLDRWNAAGVPRLPNTARLSEQVTDDFFRMVYAGETVVSNNTQTNPVTKGKANAEIGALAFITVPFHKDGAWKYLFSVHDIQPRQWRKDEIELVRELADRIFPRLERAHAEERQRESEERFRLMADNIENLAWMAQPDGYIYWYNKRWYDYTGTTPQDMEGWGWQSVHDPHELQDVLQRWNASIQTGERFNMVFPLKGADGLFRPFLTRVMPVKDTDGNVLHWFGTNTDISEQIKAAEALRKLSAQQEETLAVLESLLQNAPIGFAFFDTHHRYMRINDSLAEINGFKAEEHIGKTIEELLPENAKTVVPVLEKVMNTKEPILNLEVTGETPKAPGVTRYWLTGFYPVFIGKSQNVDFVGAVVIEITDRKKLEQQKDEFIAVASHELRTPVTSIKAYTQLLQKLFRKKGDLQSVELLTKMDGQINKLINLIADLLDVSKMQAGKLQLRLNDFNFNELVSEIVDEIQQTTTYHTIRTELTEGTMVYADRDRIEQVLTNLLTNAVKYSPQADTIIVKTHVEKETITLSVQDFGLGIPKEKQAKVFERFYRVEGRTETIYPGLGLGLYISSEIISRHGGTIWVESGEGKGSTFCFTLPIQKHTLSQQEHV